MRLLLDSDFSVPVAGTIELIDLQGRRIAALRQEAIPSGRSTLSLGSLPTSHYLFRVILDR